MTVYLRTPLGGIHSLEKDVYEQYYTQRAEDGELYPLAGYTVLKESEARKAHPQLFGAPDPRIVPNIHEIKAMREQIAFHKELEAEAARIADAD